MLKNASKRRKINAELVDEGTSGGGGLGLEGARAMANNRNPLTKIVGIESSTPVSEYGKIKLGEGAVLCLEPSAFRVENISFHNVDEMSKKNMVETFDDALFQAFKMIQSLMHANRGVSTATVEARELRSRIETLVLELQAANCLAVENRDRVAKAEEELKKVQVSLEAKEAHNRELQKEGHNVADRAVMRTTLELMLCLEAKDAPPPGDAFTACMNYFREIGEDPLVKVGDRVMTLDEIEAGPHFSDGRL